MISGEAPDRDEAMFPTLEAGQIARLSTFGEHRHVGAGDILSDQGDSEPGIFIVLDGTLEIVGVSSREPSALRAVGRGQFTGEVSHLSGRHSLVRIRASQTSTLLEITRSNLRRVIATEAELGEILLRARSCSAARISSPTLSATPS